jgi:ribosomal protein L37AE/L43A
MKCPACESTLHEKGASGIWLDEGEFSCIHHEMKGAKTNPSSWAATSRSGGAGEGVK